MERPIKIPLTSSAAHPFNVLDDFIDVGLIDLNLLPGNIETDGLRLIGSEINIFLF